MFFKKIEFPELEVVDPNAYYSGTQSIFINFDKIAGAPYDKDSLDIHTNVYSANSSSFSPEAQFQILTDLNNTSAGIGINLNARELAGGHSTAYIGDNGSALTRYGSFLALSETVTVSNEIKNNESFVSSEESSSLLLPGLELADSDAVLRGTQTIFLDFDGASDISYDNDVLDIHINLSSINDSGLNDEAQFQIMTDLNNTFAGTGVNFSITAPTGGEYSTIYVGGDGSEFSRYGFFDGLSETIDVGNEIKDDEAFIFSNKLSSTSAITETIAHEAAHLVGYQHTADDSRNELSDFATVSTLDLGSQKFTATDGAAYDTYGYSVAVSGSHVIVGSYADNVNGDDSGSAYAYRWNGSSYTEYQISDTVTGAADDWFGFAVDSYGDSIVVGADWGDGAVANSGAAYIYTWNGSSYDQTKISAADGAENDAYGDALAMSASVVVVGAYGDDDDGTSSGSAYVYRWDDVDSYDYNTKLTASDAAANMNFGYAVDVSGDNVVIGSSDGVADATGAYVYRWSGSAYVEHILSVPDDTACYSYGNAVAMDGDIVAVTAYCDNGGNGAYAGSLYVYAWNSGTEVYDLRGNFTASDISSREFFGKSVAISGNNIVVGAYGDSDNGAASGSIYAYAWNGASYDEYKILAEDGNALDFFGRSVDIDGDYIVVGAPGNDDSGYSSGSAYSFNLADIIDFSDRPDTPSGDFDGNNKSDILWRYTDGNVYTWADGEGSAFGTSLGDSTGYTFLDTGDFGDNGKSDVLLKKADGNVYSWDDGNSLSETHLGDGTGYTFLGTGDFDDNGKSDILWSEDGELWVWGNGDIANETSLGTIPVYTFLGVGDFDGDFESDILWQKADNKVYAWDSGDSLTEHELGSGTVPADYDFFGVGDFDGNGQSDILWRDTSDGNIYAWDDGASANERSLGSASASFTFLGIGDFDANRKSDILWRDADANVYVWDDGELGGGWDHLIGVASTDYTVLSSIA